MFEKTKIKWKRGRGWPKLKKSYICWRWRKNFGSFVTYDTTFEVKTLFKSEFSGYFQLNIPLIPTIISSSNLVFLIWKVDSFKSISYFYKTSVTIFRTSTSTVWPDLANCCHFATKLKPLAIFEGIISVW